MFISLGNKADEIAERLLEAIHFSLAGHDDIWDLAEATERKVNILTEGVANAITKIGEVISHATNEDAFLAQFDNVVNDDDFQEYIANIAQAKDVILSRKRGADNDADDAPLDAKRSKFLEVPRHSLCRRT